MMNKQIEQEVIRALVNGHSAEEIAEVLAIAQADVGRIELSAADEIKERKEADEKRN